MFLERKYNLKRKINMKVSNYVNLFEMARADLEGVVEVIKSGDYDKAATMYISKAKARGLDAKKVIVGLGSTFRTYEDMGADEIKQLKEKIKEKLSGELPEKKEKKSVKHEKGETSDQEKKEHAAQIKVGAKKKAELIKAPKEAPLGESTRRGILRREILERSGLIGIHEVYGDEGDQGGVNTKHPKSKSMNSGKGDASTGGKGEVAKAKGKASRKAENEEKAGEDSEGTRKAYGMDAPGKYTLKGGGSGVSGSGSKYLGGSKGSVSGGGSKYTGGSKG
jgi:hypothetical protein